MQSKPRIPRRLVAAAVTLAIAGVAAVDAGTASASAKSTSFPLELSGNQPTINLFQSPVIL